MAKKLEIEKKFLLKRLPYLPYSKVINITQLYLPDGSRIRKSEVLNQKTKFYLTKKKKIKMGVYEEDERLISERMFNSRKKRAYRIMHKTRYIYKVGKLKWEIDVYQIKMVTAEIELPKEGTKFKMPKQIAQELIMDVTEIPHFTSKSLSDKI